VNDTKEQKTWDDLRQRRALTVSASQIATAHLCVRKWWLERVRRLVKQEDNSKFIFGSVFHSCAERFLLADDTGRDKETGKPVDLFPEGWKTDLNPFTGEVVGTLNEEDAGIIKSLVHKGIDSGVLAPYPDRQVEREIRVPLGKIDAPNGPVTVSFMGFIDCASRNMIVDHKTTSSMRWALSANKLSNDPQMTIYGKMWLDHLKDLGERPDTIVLRHNQFCKDPKKLQVRATEVTVTAAYVEQMWNKLWLPTIEKMVRFRDQAEKWSDMPEPATGHNACNKYGGCGYMNICGGRISEDSMARRLGRLDNQTEPVILTADTKPLTKGTPMAESMLEKLNKMKAAKAGAKAASEKAPAKKESPVTEPDPAAELPEGMTPPPWANASCPACKGVGFSTKGAPCRVCDMKADEANKSRHFEIEAQDDGSFMWFHKDDSDNAGVSPGASFGREEPKATERVKEEVKEAAKPAPAPAPAPAPEPEAEVEVDPKEAARTDHSFTLFLNCRPLKTGKGIPKPMDLHDILEDARTQLAAASNVSSFYELDAFKRRDAVAALAPQVATAVGKGTLVACGVGTGMGEVRALIDALKPLAKQVVVGDSN